MDATGPSGNRGLGDVKVWSLLEDGAEYETTSLHAAGLSGLHEMGWAGEVWKGVDASQNNAPFHSPHAISGHAVPHPATHLQGLRPEEGDQKDETSTQILAGLQRKKLKWK